MELEQIFSKPLSHTDVNSRLAIPTECLERFAKIPEGHHSVDFTALDLEGNPWPFRLSTRTTGRHSKPVLDGRGWLAFVRAKRLNIGYIITLSREANEANGVMIYRIRAQKPTTVRLLGRNIDTWQDV